MKEGLKRKLARNRLPTSLPTGRHFRYKPEEIIGILRQKKPTPATYVVTRGFLRTGLSGKKPMAAAFILEPRGWWRGGPRWRLAVSKEILREGVPPRLEIDDESGSITFHA